MEIKIELIKLGKTQVDLKAALQKRGVKATPNQVCLALRGDQMPKMQLIRDTAREIILDWQKEKSGCTDGDKTQ